MRPSHAGQPTASRCQRRPATDPVHVPRRARAPRHQRVVGVRHDVRVRRCGQCRTPAAGHHANLVRTVELVPRQVQQDDGSRRGRRQHAGEVDLVHLEDGTPRIGSSERGDMARRHVGAGLVAHDGVARRAQPHRQQPRRRRLPVGPGDEGHLAPRALRCSRRRGSTRSPARPPATVPWPRPRRREAALTTRVVALASRALTEGAWCGRARRASARGAPSASRGSCAVMASMMVAVSALASVSDKATGLPTRTVTVGGLRTRVKSGRRAERGQTFSVPHERDRHDGGAGRRGQARRAGLAVEHRIEEVVPTRDGPCGRTMTTSPAFKAASAARSGWPDPLPRSTAIPPMAHAMHPDHRGVEDLLLAEEAHRSPDLAGDEGRRGDVEVAPVVRRQQDRAACGHVVDTRDVEAGVRKRQLAHERAEQVVRLESDDARDAGWPVPVLHRPAPRRGHHREGRIGVHGVGRTDAREQRHVEDTVAAGVAVGEVDALGARPLPHRAELARPPPNPS